MPWLWMSVFGSILKSDHLTQTEWFGKELSWFLSLPLSIHMLFCGWKGVLQWGLSVGILRMRVMGSLKVSSGDAEEKWMLSLCPHSSM